MPYKDLNIQREYQNRWVQNRRLEWLKENGPCVDCGGIENLQVDHVDPTQKITHRIWSWSKERRDKELLKCLVRCKECHVEKGRRNGDNFNLINAVLTEDLVKEIKHLLSTSKLTQVEIGEKFGVDHSTVSLIHRKKSWDWL